MRPIIFIMAFLSGISLYSQEKYITTSDNVQLYLKIKGSGSPCLYIHGGPGSGGNWMEEFMGDSLELHFQMIYLDQRGVGRSSSPEDNNYSMDRMVADFEEVRKAMGIDQWLTLGHSIGGILQMAYVTNNPDAISGMIFINCTLDMKDSFGNSWLPRAMDLLGEDVPKICLDTTVSVYQRMLAIMPELGARGEMWKVFFANEEDSWKMNETYHSIEGWNSDQSEQILEFDEYWYDYRPLSSNIKKPVLFYYGETDWAIGPDHYKGVKFPNIILWSSKGGHMPFLENKADLLHALDSYILKYQF